jgi:hypothetical protein
MVTITTGFCAALDNQEDCVEPRSDFNSNAPKCSWNSNFNGESCTYNAPQTKTEVVFYVLILAVLVGLPPSKFQAFVIEKYLAPAVEPEKEDKDEDKDMSDRVVDCSEYLGSSSPSYLADSPLTPLPPPTKPQEIQEIFIRDGTIDEMKFNSVIERNFGGVRYGFDSDSDTDDGLIPNRREGADQPQRRRVVGQGQGQHDHTAHSGLVTESNVSIPPTPSIGYQTIDEDLFTPGVQRKGGVSDEVSEQMVEIKAKLKEHSLSLAGAEKANFDGTLSTGRLMYHITAHMDVPL